MDNVNIESLSNEELRDLLVKHGQSCGPVVKTTRKVYENKLKRVLSSGGGGGSRNVPVSVHSTPGSVSSDRLPPTVTTNSSGSRGGIRDRSSNYFSDATDTYDDDQMEGEESFRYVNPVNDTPPSPYSALGGSMIATPPAPPRVAASNTSTIGQRLLDYGLSGTYTSVKPPSSYSFTSGHSPTSKTGTISYHTAGYSPEPYRRSVAPAVAPRAAAPINPYGSSIQTNRFAPFSLDTNQALEKGKIWAPTVAKIFGLILFVIFVVFFINKLNEGAIEEEKADESLKLPA